MEIKKIRPHGRISGDEYDIRTSSKSLINVTTLKTYSKDTNISNFVQELERVSDSRNPLYDNQ